MKFQTTLITTLLCCISQLTFAQWQISTGTAGLNMQSLLHKGTYDFAGGATGAYRSIDSAATYSFSNAGNDAVGPTRGFTKDSNYVYTCTSQGVYRSSDNGANWISKSSGITNLLSSGITSAGTKLFMVGVGGVYMSTDSAENWSITGLSGVDVRSITAMQDTLYIGTLNSGIYKSIDWGVNWIPANNGLGASNGFRAIECKGTTLFAAGPIGTGVYRSTDFGANWVLLSGGLPSGSFRGFASNNQLIVAGSFGAGVYYSTDNGNNWTAINNGLTDLQIFDLELNDHYIIAATNTAGVFRYPIASLNLSGVGSDLNEENLISIFPNPTTNEIHIKTNNILSGSDYTVFDGVGKAVSSGILHADDTVIELGHLPNGVYSINVGRYLKHSFKVIKE